MYALPTSTGQLPKANVICVTALNFELHALDLEIFDFNPSNQCNLMFPFCENVFVPN
jgi:hypothetical protein